MNFQLDKILKMDAKNYEIIGMDDTRHIKTPNRSMSCDACKRLAGHIINVDIMYIHKDNYNDIHKTSISLSTGCHNRVNKIIRCLPESDNENENKAEPIKRDTNLCSKCKGQNLAVRTRGNTDIFLKHFFPRDSGLTATMNPLLCHNCDNESDKSVLGLYNLQIKYNRDVQTDHKKYQTRLKSTGDFKIYGLNCTVRALVANFKKGDLNPAIIVPFMECIFDGKYRLKEPHSLNLFIFLLLNDTSNGENLIHGVDESSEVNKLNKSGRKKYSTKIKLAGINFISRLPTKYIDYCLEREDIIFSMIFPTACLLVDSDDEDA